jgi:hypothetical protein
VATHDRCRHFVVQSLTMSTHWPGASALRSGHGSVFAKGPKMSKSAGGKTGKVTVKQEDGKKKTVYQRPKGTKSEPNVSSDTRYGYLLAKFQHDQLARRVLLATGRAKLTHWTRGMSAVHVDVEMMRVRAHCVGQLRPTALPAA